MFEYKQRATTREYLEGWDAAFAVPQQPEAPTPVVEASGLSVCMCTLDGGVCPACKGRRNHVTLLNRVPARPLPFCGTCDEACLGSICPVNPLPVSLQVVS